MAKDDDKPVTRGEMAKFIDVVDAEIRPLRERQNAFDTRLESCFAKDDLVPGLDAFNGRLEALENSGRGDSAAPILAANKARAARAKGEATIPEGTVVRFKPHDGSGPKKGYAAIVCGSLIPREHFAAIYILWVLVPRKAYWEENIKEGTGDGTLQVI